MIKIQLRLGLLLGICCAMFLAVGCGESDNSLERVVGRGSLRIGLDPTYPPFENADTGELHGLDVDLGRALAAQMGVTADFTYFGFDGLYDALGTEQVDVLLSALPIDQAKTRDFAYTAPYFDAGQVIVVLDQTAEDEAISGPVDLENNVVAVEIGTDGHIQALEWQKRVAGLQIRPINTADDAMWIVLQGEVDAAIVDAVSGRLYVRTFPDLQVLEDQLTNEPYALVLRVEDEKLRERLDEGLNELRDSGELEAIISNWLD